MECLILIVLVVAGLGLGYIILKTGYDNGGIDRIDMLVFVFVESIITAMFLVLSYPCLAERILAP